MTIPVWEMVKEAIAHFSKEVGYAEIRQYVREKYGNINESTINCAIIASSVNHASRIHYQENKKVRISSGIHDFLFKTRRGGVAPYDPAKHGQWEIYIKEDNSLSVREIENLEDTYQEADAEPVETYSLFALESHLRDYMAKNMAAFDGLAIYTENGRDGIEFQTDVGPIDILAQDVEGNFVVFELKLRRGPDACLGQILRYIGWVERHLAKDKHVRGIIVASNIPTKLRYAVTKTQTPNISLMEYKLNFSVNKVTL